MWMTGSHFIDSLGGDHFGSSDIAKLGCDSRLGEGRALFDIDIDGSELLATNLPEMIGWH